MITTATKTKKITTTIVMRTVGIRLIVGQKGTCRVYGWIKANLAFWSCLSYIFLVPFEVPFFSSPFLRLEIVSAIKWRIGIGWQGETQEYPNIQTKYVVIPILKAGLPLNPGNLQMVNSGQSSKFWLTDPPLHRWFKARPTLFMQSSPLIFLAPTSLSKSSGQIREKTKFVDVR